MISRAYKVRLSPNRAQSVYFGRCCGLARFAYNWALARRIEVHEATGKSIPLSELQREFRARRGTEWPWALELPDRVSEMAIRNLDTAYRNFFRRVKSGAEKPGFPRFHARHPGYGSFQVMINPGHIHEAAIRLPKVGPVRLAESSYLPLDLSAQYITATVSERATKWYVSVQVDVPRPAPEHGEGLTAVHLCSRHLAVTLKDGLLTRYENPKPLARELRHLAKLQRAVARKTKGSANRRKAVARLQRLHERIADVRRDAGQRATTEIVRSSAGIALEKWPIKKLMGDAIRPVARHMSDVAFAELARQIEYKTNWRGVNLVRLAEGFPSTKRCARCGAINPEMTLERIMFDCPKCGHRAGREVNAVENVMLETTGKPPECNAPGGDPSGSPVNGESERVVGVVPSVVGDR